MAVLAIIPARGGSKSVPLKNIALVAGKPLIAFTLEAALTARCIERTIVTTDSPEIAEVARRYGAEVPFLRPSELAQDDTPGLVPILHAARWLQAQEGHVPEYIMCLQPTSPLRTRVDIEAAVSLAAEREAEAVISVAPVHQHPYWMQRIDPAGRLQPYDPQGAETVRRQALPPVYALNGAIYLARLETLLARGTWYTEETYAYVMPAERSLDVDTAWDLRLAEAILRERAQYETR
jgi:N-acylneuraminate cytidylyltransferase/CMP-N,N'-diacetyllegionaminic acid synthase